MISSTSPALSTPFGLCPADFRQLFLCTEEVISKGQAGLETLCAQGRDVLFLFIKKCPIISGAVEDGMNSFIAMESC